MIQAPPARVLAEKLHASEQARAKAEAYARKQQTERMRHEARARKLQKQLNQTQAHRVKTKPSPHRLTEKEQRDGEKRKAVLEAALEGFRISR